MVKTRIMLKHGKEKREERLIDSFDELIEMMNKTDDVIVISKGVELLNKYRKELGKQPVDFEVIIS